VEPVVCRRDSAAEQMYEIYVKERAREEAAEWAVTPSGTGLGTSRGPAGRESEQRRKALMAQQSGYRLADVARHQVARRLRW